MLEYKREDVACLFVEFFFVEEHAQTAARLAANEHVLRDAQVIHQLEFLMNDADAGGLRFARTEEGDGLTVVEDFA